MLDPPRLSVVVISRFACCVSVSVSVALIFVPTEYSSTTLSLMVVTNKSPPENAIPFGRSCRGTAEEFTVTPVVVYSPIE